RLTRRGNRHGRGGQPQERVGCQATSERQRHQCDGGKQDDAPCAAAASASSARRPGWRGRTRRTESRTLGPGPPIGSQGEGRGRWQRSSSEGPWLGWATGNAPVRVFVFPGVL